MRRAHPGDVQDVARTVASAFASDPLFSWAFPDPARRRGHLERMAAPFARVALARGVVDLEPGRAVAIWYPPSVSPGASTLLRAGLLGPLLRAGGRTAWRLQRSEAQAARAKNLADPDGSSWYLAMLAVLPRCQGQGNAGRLLRAGTERADLTGATVWLETNTRRNAEMYERFGFEVTTHDGAGRLPEFWGMLRPTRPGLPAPSRG